MEALKRSSRRMSNIDAKPSEAHKREPSMLELMTDFFRDISRALSGSDPAKVYMKRREVTNESRTH